MCILSARLRGDSMVDFKETEFNSSVATLKRIDALMMELHKAGFDNHSPNRLGLLRRLNVEGHEKFTGDEKKKCIKYEMDLLNVEINNDESKVEKNVYHVHPEKYKHNKLIEKWKIMKPIIDSYELYVIGCLDRHGMLMKNKEETDETPETWED